MLGAGGYTDELSRPLTLETSDLETDPLITRWSGGQERHGSRMPWSARGVTLSLAGGFWEGLLKEMRAKLSLGEHVTFSHVRKGGESIR